MSNEPPKIISINRTSKKKEPQVLEKLQDIDERLEQLEKLFVRILKGVLAIKSKHDEEKL